MKAEKRNQLAEKAFREMVDRILIKDYKILGSKDGDKIIYFNPSQRNPKVGAYTTCELFDLRVKVLYYNEWYINSDNHENANYKFDDSQEYKQIYIVDRIFENKYNGLSPKIIPALRQNYDSEDAGFAFLDIAGKRIRLDKDMTLIEVSEDHFNRWGPLIVKKAYLPLKYSDFTSSDTIDTFGDLMSEL